MSARQDTERLRVIGLFMLRLPAVVKIENRVSVVAFIFQCFHCSRAYFVCVYLLL